MRMLISCCLLVGLLCVAEKAKAQAVPLDASLSKITVHVYKSGLFSAFAHDHVITAPLASGSVDTNARSVQLEFDTKDMKVVDPGVSASERSQVEQTMKSSEVLAVARFPTITFTAARAELANGSYRVSGTLTLHGVSRSLEVPVSFSGGHYTGSVKLKQSDFGITPIRIAGGTVKVKDVVDVSFDIVPSAIPQRQ